MPTNTLLTPRCLDVPSADRAAIVDALYRFGAGQDLKSSELFESAFTEGATLDFTGPARRLGADIPVFEGLAMISETVLGSTADLDTTHSVTNPRITAYDGERATLFALVEAQHLPKNDHSRHLLLKNIYAMDVVRESSGRWAIAHMIIDNVWYTGNRDVLFP